SCSSGGLPLDGWSVGRLGGWVGGCGGWAGAVGDVVALGGRPARFARGRGWAPCSLRSRARVGALLAALAGAGACALAPAGLGACEKERERKMKGVSEDGVV